MCLVLRRLCLVLSLVYPWLFLAPYQEEWLIALSVWPPSCSVAFSQEKLTYSFPHSSLELLSRMDDLLLS